MSSYVRENFVDWEYITSPIVLAACSKECQSDVAWKTTCINFINNRLFNSMKLSQELRDGSYKKRRPRKFNLVERGKVREISPVNFRDRIVEKSLCENCLLPLIVPKLIESNCASLPERGLSLSKKLFTEHLINAYKRYGSSGYFVKFDYSDYFHSIDNDICFSQLERLIKGELGKGYLRDGRDFSTANDSSVEKLLSLLRVFIYDEQGLGLGNQTSQTAAIYYPHEIDNWCYKFCGGLYGRYMDDSYGFVKSKVQAREMVIRVREMSESLGLHVSEKKTFYVLISSEICWLKDRYKIGEFEKEKVKCLIKPTKSVIRYGLKHLKKTKNVLPINDWLLQKQNWINELNKRKKTIVFFLGLRYRQWVNIIISPC